MKIFNQFTLLLLLTTTFNSMHAMTEADWQNELGDDFFTTKKSSNFSINFVKYLNKFDEEFGQSMRKNHPKEFLEYVGDYTYWVFYIDENHLLKTCLSIESTSAIFTLTRHGANLNKQIKTNYGIRTPLQYVFDEYRWDMGTVLIEAGAEITISDILHKPCASTSDKALKFIDTAIKYGAPVNKKINSKTPLDIAAFYDAYPPAVLLAFHQNIALSTIEDALLQAKTDGMKLLLSTAIASKKSAMTPRINKLSCQSANTIISTQNDNNLSSSNKSDDESWNW